MGWPSRSSGTPRMVRMPDSCGFVEDEFRVGEDVFDLDRAQLDQRPAGQGASLGEEGTLVDDGAEGFGHAIGERDHAEDPAHVAEDVAFIGVGEAHRIVDYRLEHGAQTRTLIG